MFAKLSVHPRPHPLCVVVIGSAAVARKLLSIINVVIQRYLRRRTSLSVMSLHRLLVVHHSFANKSSHRSLKTLYKP